MTRALATTLALAMLTACDSSPCGAPDHVTYNCQPSFPGCHGGPVVQGSADHLDNFYPAGCIAQEPACSDADPSKPVEAVCTEVRDGSASAYVWSSLP